MSDQNCLHCSGRIVEEVCEDCGRPAGKKPLITAGTGEGGGSSATANTTKRTTATGRFTVNYPTRKMGAGDTTKPTRRRAGTTAHSSSRRKALGGGLISLPDRPSQDPVKLLMSVPEVPEHKRRCPSCDNKVTRTKGFCPKCGSQYDFEPHLKPGEIVNSKYEVKGPIAFGGLGWIYLGWDTQLSRWVVLKGLLNAKDESSAAAAVAERQFLAAVKHAKIVGIYDFVNHHGEGYIIMEYVGGVTVHSLRKLGGPLPVEEAIAYILGVLPAFAYLHEQGMVYCDFKPDNIMLEAGDVKLIDMGAVRKIGDPHGDIFGTVGFMAPEASDDPKAVSDIYTIGRALATLVMEFKHASEYESSLPTPEAQPVLAENESLYRFLLRATHLDPDERFQKVDEMAEQLFGVLREIVALKSDPKPADSKAFTGEVLLQAGAADLMRWPVSGMLPAIRVDLNDRAIGDVMRVLGITDPGVRLVELEKLDAQHQGRSMEPRLRMVETLMLGGGDRSEVVRKAIGLLDQIELEDPFDWRPHWLRGVLMLGSKQGKAAMACFERVYFEMPGEVAPRLAMGVAAELAGLQEQAIQYYDRVGRVDPGYVSANFGLARCHAALGQMDEAISALQRVPATHNLRSLSLLCITQLVLEREEQLTQARLKIAEEAIRSVLPEGGAAYSLAAKLLVCLLRAIAAKHNVWPPGTSFLGVSINETSLRLAAESYFRQAAKFAKDGAERSDWVLNANEIRPITLI